MLEGILAVLIGKKQGAFSPENNRLRMTWRRCGILVYSEMETTPNYLFSKQVVPIFGMLENHREWPPATS
jgi:hypothetical protein